MSGPLVDNYGRKPIALLGLTLYIAGSAIAATASSFPLFLLARVVQGYAVCCSAVVAFSGVRDQLSGDDAARAYGFLNGALNIVPALAPLLGGLLASAFGWRAPFWFPVYLCRRRDADGHYLAAGNPSGRYAACKGLSVNQYAAILRQPRFLAFAFANAGALGMVLTYVSLAPHILMTEGGLSPLAFSFAFGANGFWIMLVSVVVNKAIRKAGRPFCLAMGCLTMLLGAGLLLAGMTLLPDSLQSHWALYMFPVAVAVAGLAFTVGPATSYALEPYQQQAGVASALQGFIQMAGGAAGSLLIVALPLAEKMSLALMMLLGAALAFLAWRCSKNMHSRITAIK